MTEFGDSADSTSVAKPECQPFGRPAAGEDPIKREQILDGAQCIFMRMGFDAASMNDITREAGVSKGTLYVYFKNKEDLFAAIITRQKLAIYALLEDLLAKKLSLEETLYQFGVILATHLLSEKAIRGQRIVIGVIDRMPELANTFFAHGPNSGPNMFANYLHKQVELGKLKPMDDAVLISRQFGDLCLAGLFRPRLFGEMKEPPPAERIEKNVETAVRLFMNAYGR
ncbi:TetR/AcrR family transcriptional regulator [Rhizobium sp. KVB221]|uniref:TetR/AcrR family transcriptional regulator n=1 Tax=Rhizobium setariae TaxID=2801340 RepID=A0A937CNW4_9HYPH|nr:TetR/AcrR family transcriptional regulator [Rhizobium setariae]MBL0371693.1 TetR/AcrR family transcriptional regulator [Rhizobium setariae]